MPKDDRRVRLAASRVVVGSLAAVFVVVIAGCGRARPAADAARVSCDQRLLTDWTDGLIDRAYRSACYRAAIASLTEARTLEADELRAELAASRSGFVPADQRGRAGAPRDPCPSLDPVAPCPESLSAFKNTAPIRVSGDVNARRLIPGGGNYPTCGFRQNSDTLIFSSGQLQLGRRAAVGVTITMPHVHPLGSYSATTPKVAYGRTPVQVGVSLDRGRPLLNKLYLAQSGTMSIRYANGLGQRGRYAFVVGHVRATLVDHQSRKRIRLDGTWICSAEPVANGPS
ncbi:MAG: hypothetical protein M3P18_14400 [Actinomycetota bacterium]|nr:hypothetical protein [Actinomycetota bacterium]